MEMRERMSRLVREDWEQGYDVGEPSFQGEPEPYEVENPDSPNNQASDDLDTYLFTLAAALMYEFDIDEDMAVDFIAQVADTMAEAGKLPPLPWEDEDPSLDALWLGQAVTSGFHGIVGELANEEFGEEE